nr:hypothetical protein Iba_chr05fCG14350 [Ipomoea batatas]
MVSGGFFAFLLPFLPTVLNPPIIKNFILPMPIPLMDTISQSRQRLVPSNAMIILHTLRCVLKITPHLLLPQSSLQSPNYVASYQPYSHTFRVNRGEDFTLETRFHLLKLILSKLPLEASGQEHEMSALCISAAALGDESGGLGTDPHSNISSPEQEKGCLYADSAENLIEILSSSKQGSKNERSQIGKKCSVWCLKWIRRRDFWMKSLTLSS